MLPEKEGQLSVCQVRISAVAVENDVSAAVMRAGGLGEASAYLARALATRMIYLGKPVRLCVVGIDNLAIGRGARIWEIVMTEGEKVSTVLVICMFFVNTEWDYY